MKFSLRELHARLVSIRLFARDWWDNIVKIAEVTTPPIAFDSRTGKLVVDPDDPQAYLKELNQAVREHLEVVFKNAEKAGKVERVYYIYNLIEELTILAMREIQQ